jgi:hypothetical protein
MVAGYEIGDVFRIDTSRPAAAGPSKSAAAKHVADLLL